MNIPKVNLGFYPTPIYKLEKISNELNQNIFIKRDDLTGIAFGGNKIRKLQYFIADAIEQEAKALVTVGAPQSNHVRQTIAAGIKFGFDVHVALYKPEQTQYQGNLLLDALMGAHIHWIDSKNYYEEIIKITGVLKDCHGKMPYFIPVGGSNEIGAWGYISAAEEIAEQQKKLGLEFDYIIIPSSSGGTQAGLIIGKKLHNLKAQIIGINIAKYAYADKTTLNSINTILHYFIEKHSIDYTFREQDIILIEKYNEPGYGILTNDEKKTIAELAKKEAIFLDPVYTARAFWALIDLTKNNFFKNKANILFIHTGGTPAIFAYANQLYNPPKPGEANKNILLE